MPDMSKALIVWGGWDGHEPELVSNLFSEILKGEGFEVEVETELSTFRDRGESLKDLDLIVPVWTMGTIQPEEVWPVVKAVESGVGLAGCHGGMGDSFRNETAWQFMVGGQWVAHPGDDGVEYEVRITDKSHPITQGLPDFRVKSEQYYMHTDPSNHVLAVTAFPVADGPHVPNGPFDMPVIWTRLHGQGRVFYNSLGHHADVLDDEPVRETMRRGFLWAAKRL
jgi:type 1 glutamine amidotransferase